ncbi:YigZ family protein [Alicyclobacillus dauci]|uniref:YigZ family protein n=1 Tax=Alicyclobacillus dauci TaxID=1475485 RepID=A0ABY6Z1T1_9BACL|nr:YigZ family protein [Alicyclobacillus dauci]WAH36840.1 YigZ family protein [Alicyclobacillus dauci]
MQFTTPEARNTVETVEKKSKFIASLFPILSVSEAEEALAQIREEHKTANHNCFAYRVGLGVPVERFSDDGEPSGTAGRPILEVIRRREIDNVLVVVTRYFGGVLLGASGLVRVYADATSQVLNATPMLRCGLMHTLEVSCDYGMYGKLEYALGQEGMVMIEKQFAEAVSFQLVVAEADVEKRVTQLNEWTNGQANVNVLPAEYIGVSEDGSLVRGVWPSDGES